MRQQLLSLALALAGCGGATGATPPPAHPEPISNTTEPAPPPAAAAANIELGVSVGPVRLGMKRNEVGPAVGTAPEIDSDTPEYDQFPSRGLEVQYDDKSTAVAIHAYSAEQAGYETRARTAFPLQGPNGIHWGSTVEEVTAAMGGAKGKTGDLPSAPVPTHWMSYDNVMFDFVTSNGHLFHIVVFPPDSSTHD